ncbi:hypothetical protein [Pseudobacillus badius]|uniref:hypothetical protein n=1 Tax=Bacillus badius TaxID=1455 RepID=UPI001CC08B85|nr:hypothetical protein [Bacillus badius]UAT28926.1 hypothetical protein K7T73_09765 [Bacillus badius]GLY12695.1 hypothetical protein Bbad01_39110 [Bacillus badius]
MKKKEASRIIPLYRVLWLVPILVFFLIFPEPNFGFWGSMIALLLCYSFVFQVVLDVKEGSQFLLSLGAIAFCFFLATAIIPVSFLKNNEIKVLLMLSLFMLASGYVSRRMYRYVKKAERVKGSIDE